MEYLSQMRLSWRVYEMEKIFGWFMFILALLLFLLCVTACATAANTDRAVLEHQQQIDRLEEELRNRDRAIESAVKDIRELTSRSSRMEGSIDAIIELFGEYQRRVDRMLSDYYYLQNKTGTQDKSGSNTAGSANN